MTLAQQAALEVKMISEASLTTWWPLYAEEVRVEVEVATKEYLSEIEGNSRH